MRERRRAAPWRTRGRVRLLLAAFAVTTIACAPSADTPPTTPANPADAPTIAPTQTYSYTRDIQPLLEARCVACHACNDAPCQLKLTSAAGLQRGATRLGVYDASRLRDAEPTRLYIDAESTEQWRAKGFHSVFNDSGGPLSENLERSVLYRMLELGRQQPLSPGTPVPESISLGLERENACPNPADFDGYARTKPDQGMPLAITGLEDREYEMLRTWILEGGVIDREPAVVGREEQGRIRAWEEFFNRPAPKNQLTSRYLYEHLFSAHLYFDDLDTGNFFELVRSSTPPGERILDVATRRPNDDPGRPFHYRLRRLEGTIVHKSHMPYPLDSERMARLEALFLSPDWDIEELPAYSLENAINPFIPFAAIPARARYQFMLDSAEYFVMTFIRGPVCAGQVATNVIRDHFYILFQDPEADLSVTDAGYLAKIQPNLVLVPQDRETLLALEHNWLSRQHARSDYVRQRGEEYRKRRPEGPSLADIWDGDGANHNAALTVFRNFDNAMVTQGLVGDVPETLWVMDYPLFERTYYLLVANFDVFGSVASQVETRLYFDLIRSGSENNFLHFMPPASRTALRDSWYRGTRAQLKALTTYVVANEELPVQIAYRTQDPKREFVALISKRLGPVAGPVDALNRCAKAPCSRPAAKPAERTAETLLQTLASKAAELPTMAFVRFMPDVAFLRIRVDGPEHGDLAYTLIRNKAHTNVAFMFNEEKRRDPNKDTLTVFRGLIGSYPNFMFEVPLGKLADFAAALHDARAQADFVAVVNAYGRPRLHPEIWNSFEWFVDHDRRLAPVDAGVYDLNRYKTVSELVADESG